MKKSANQISVKNSDLLRFILMSTRLSTRSSNYCRNSGFHYAMNYDHINSESKNADEFIILNETFLQLSVI